MVRQCPYCPTHALIGANSHTPKLSSGLQSIQQGVPVCLMMGLSEIDILKLTLELVIQRETALSKVILRVPPNATGSSGKCFVQKHLRCTECHSIQ